MHLPFGIASASEVFPKIMSHLFQDTEGIDVIVDDLAMCGEDVEQDNARLR